MLKELDNAESFQCHKITEFQTCAIEVVPIAGLGLSVHLVVWAPNAVKLSKDFSQRLSSVQSFCFTAIWPGNEKKERSECQKEDICCKSY